MNNTLLVHECGLRHLYENEYVPLIRSFDCKKVDELATRVKGTYDKEYWQLIRYTHTYRHYDTKPFIVPFV